MHPFRFADFYLHISVVSRSLHNGGESFCQLCDALVISEFCQSSIICIGKCVHEGVPKGDTLVISLVVAEKNELQRKDEK